MKIRKVERAEDVRVNALFYGITGVGKTTLLGTAQKCPATSPILLIDVAGGTHSLAGRRIDIVRPVNFTEIQEIYDFLRHDNTKYKSVGIDSITEIQRQLSMAGILGDIDENASHTNLAGTTPADRYDWLSSGEQMRKFIRAFRDLAYLPDVNRRIHVFITALEKMDENRSVICPSLPGLLGVEIGASLDILARLSVEQVLVSEEEDSETTEARHLLLHERQDDSGSRILAKVRTPVPTKFPKEMWSPTVSKLVGTWVRLATAGTAERRATEKTQ